MSYDIRIGVKVEGLDVIAVIDEPERSSPTYNIGDLLRACMGWDFVQGEWYRVSEVLPKILHGLDELMLHRSNYKRYEPSNGWGSVGTAYETLSSIVECIRENTGESYWTKWQQIPAEHLWIRW